MQVRFLDTGSAADQAAGVLRRLADVGIDMDDVGRTLEAAGVASFHDSFAGVLDALTVKAGQLAAHRG